MPTNSQIQSAIEEVGDSTEFVILGQNELSYIQVAGEKKNGFVLEYQWGSLKEHYHCLESDISMEKVVEVFQQYSAGDSHWKQLCEWEKIDLVQPMQERIETHVSSPYKEILHWVGVVLLTGISIVMIKFNSVDLWLQSLGWESKDALVYVYTFCFGLSYPWALEYKQRPYDIQDFELAVAWVIFFLVPVFGLLCIYAFFS